ncbi:hypothetical protein FOCC_FOCC013614 [Frankliniella occidentalis]|nr:hypothetical protein FOCC_FOCC013614 [Frankliniella occidentalis]
MHAADAVVRCYLARVNVLLHDIVDRSIIGQVKAYVGVHEFTTSGLPHFHLAVILNEQDRPASPEEIVAFISAEIPDDTDPELRKLVLGLMMHRPCDGTSPGYEKPLSVLVGQLKLRANCPWTYRSVHKRGLAAVGTFVTESALKGQRRYKPVVLHDLKGRKNLSAYGRNKASLTLTLQVFACAHQHNGRLGDQNDGATRVQANVHNVLDEDVDNAGRGRLNNRRGREHFPPARG